MTLLFAMHGMEKNTDRIKAYLIALSELNDRQFTWIIKEATHGNIGDPAYMPSAPLLLKHAEQAPSEPQKYDNVQSTPAIWEQLPGNKWRVTREAISFWGKEKISEWINREITDEMIEDTSEFNKFIAPPKKEIITTEGNVE